DEIRIANGLACFKHIIAKEAFYEDVHHAHKNPARAISSANDHHCCIYASIGLKDKAAAMRVANLSQLGRSARNRDVWPVPAIALHKPKTRIWKLSLHSLTPARQFTLQMSEGAAERIVIREPSRTQRHDQVVATANSGCLRQTCLPDSHICDVPAVEDFTIGNKHQFLVRIGNGKRSRCLLFCTEHADAAHQSSLK